MTHWDLIKRGLYENHGVFRRWLSTHILIVVCALLYPSPSQAQDLPLAAPLDIPASSMVDEDWMDRIKKVLEGYRQALILKNQEIAQFQERITVLSAAQQELRVKEDTIRVLTEDLSRVVERNAIFEKQLRDYETQRRQQHQDHQILQGTLLEWEKKFAALERQHRALSEDFAIVRNNLAKASQDDQQQRAQWEAERQSYQHDIKRYHEQLESTRFGKARLEQGYLDQLKVLNQQKADVEQQLSGAIQQNHERHTLYEASSQKLKHTLQGLQEQHAALKQESEQKRQQLQSELETIESRHQETKNTLGQKIQDQDRLVVSLQEKIARADQKIKDLNEGYENEKDKWASQQQQREKEIQRLQAQIEYTTAEHEEKIHRLYEERAERYLRLAALENQEQIWTQQRGELEEALQQTKWKIEQQDKESSVRENRQDDQMDILRKERGQLQEALAVQQQDYQSLWTKFQAMTDQLQEENARLNQDIHQHVLEKETSVESYRNELAKLKEEHSLWQKKSQAWKKQEAQSKKMIKALEQERDQLQKVSLKQQKESETIADRYQTSRELAQKQHDALTNALHQAKDQRTAIDAAMKDMALEHQRTTDVYEERLAELMRRSEQIAKIRHEESQGFKRDQKRFEEKIAGLEAKVEDLHQNLTTAQRTQQDQATQIQEAHKMSAALENELAGVTAEKDALVERYESDVNGLVADLKHEIDEQKEQQQRLVMMHTKELQTLNETRKSLQVRVVKEKEEKESIQKKLEAQQRVSTDRIDVLTKQMQDMEQENRRLLQDHDQERLAFQQQNDVLAQRLVDHQTAAVMLDEVQNELQIRVTELEQQLSQSKEDAAKQALSSRQHIAEKMETIARLKQEIQKAGAKEKALQTKLSYATDDWANEKRVLEAQMSHQQSQALKELKDHYEARVTQLQENLDLTEKNLAALFDEKNAVVQDMQTALAHEKRDKGELQRLLDERNTAHQTQMALFQKTMDEQQNTIQSLRNENKVFAEKNEQLRMAQGAENKDLRQDNQQLKAILLELKKDSHQNLASYRSEAREMRQLLGRLTQQWQHVSKQGPQTIAAAEPAATDDDHAEAIAEAVEEETRVGSQVSEPKTVAILNEADRPNDWEVVFDYSHSAEGQESSGMTRRSFERNVRVTEPSLAKRVTPPVTSPAPEAFVVNTSRESVAIPIFPEGKTLEGLDVPRVLPRVSADAMNQFMHLVTDEEADHVYHWYQKNVSQKGWKIFFERRPGVAVPGMIKAQWKGYTLIISVHRGQKTGIVGTIHEAASPSS